MILRVAVLNGNVSGAVSTTGSHLDTSCGVYDEISIIMHSFAHNHSGKVKGIYGHFEERHTSSLGTTKLNGNDHCQ